MDAAAAGELLAAVNACLNATCGALLCAGLAAIRAGRRGRHARLMVAAFAVSVVFLACYLSRVALTGTHHFAGEGALRAAYYAVLFSHMTLAALVPFLAIRALWLAARRKDFARHRRIARVTWPIWMYVSVTGVIVYLMLYHLG